MKLFWLFLFVVAVCLTISLVQDINNWAKNYPVLDNGYCYTYIPKDKVLKRMRYHGILIAHVDSRGRWYFTRSGKTIKLFKEDSK